MKPSSHFGTAVNGQKIKYAQGINQKQNNKTSWNYTHYKNSKHEQQRKLNPKERNTRANTIQVKHEPEGRTHTAAGSDRPDGEATGCLGCQVLGCDMLTGPIMH
ncbi:hypothetical protein E2C01_056988 [Portunus trituberculatus]|uniref:Uncharacterized protein n=1 Tax=Portunus trituberculatus TaxID=210409 RepID=A0A5B7H140_PORTR|nr:hypothetical protein [Portunus trituberculatus]